jgi:N-acetylneuraminic acid mutarotase
MNALRSHRWRLALAGIVAASAAVAIALLAEGDQANGGADASAGRWVALQPSPLARTEVGAARIGRFVYVVGGFVPPADTSDQVARYDTERGEWTLVSPMPTGVNHPAVAVSGGRLYVYGGYTADRALGGEVDTLQRYDPATNSWALLRGSGAPRAAATLARVGGSLYAIGGAGQGRVQSLVQIYDIARDSWRPGPDMKVPREHLASAVIKRRIIVLGGRDAGQNLNVVEGLNTRSAKWTLLPHLRTARSGFQAATVKGKVVVVGGEQLAEGDQTIGPVELYEPAAKRWRALPAMPTPRHGLGVASRGRTVFAIEGGPRPGLAFSSALEAMRVPKRLLRR